MNAAKPKDIDGYIERFPDQIQERLKQVRDTIKKAAPLASEVISYGMPGFKLNGMLVWFAGHSKHIGFYPRASGISSFNKELSKYNVSKGTVQFPHNEPLPVVVIAKIVKFRVSENLKKA